MPRSEASETKLADAKTQRRVKVAITLATLGTSAILVAQGTTHLTAGSFMPLDTSALAPAPLGDVAPARREDVDPTQILRRNIFDSATGRLDILPEPERTETGDDGDEEEVVEEIDPNAPPPPCEGSIRLVGSFVRTRSPEDSFAAITDSAGQAMLYQPGMRVDDRDVVEIARNVVILRPRGGQLCSISMFDDQPRVATAPRQVPAIATSEEGDGPDSSDLESGISQISEREYAIERSLVDRLLANQAALMRTARVIPHEEGGQVVGVKLYGIRRSSLLGRLGVQNGDMLRTINGFDMSAADSALEAYARLRGADRITLNLVRRGQPMTMDYQIR